MTTITDLRLVTANEDRYEQMILKQPSVTRDIEYFKANIGKVSTVDAFMADDRLYRFVMEAFDLESQIYARALIRKVLEQGVVDDGALANRLNDSKFKEMATVLSFAETGGLALKEPKVVQAIVDRYVRVNLEVESEETNPAVRLGLYFQRKAPTLTNWYQVMADKALREVVYTMLDLPDELGMLDVDKQKEILSKRMDVADFKDPEKVAKMLDRFAVMYDIQNGSATVAAATPSIGPLSGGGSSIISIDPSITMTLLNFPRF
ncbi:DUF1217 domain-containing protein [Azospirillum sp. ST 5-10]|uniref:DUF1217 domain-containing protein n=1 Tax=unclassified Azospirillum TaxID=2630922 RepID=UPI003F4A5E4A